MTQSHKSNVFLLDTLQELQDKNLLRQLREVDGPQGAGIVLNGQKVLNFCSNNYLGLAGDFRVKEAAIKAIEEEGFGSGASRLVCGNMRPHQRLEETLAQFKKTEAALVFSTGYMANVGIISSLFGRGDIIFADRLDHASLIDGIILSQAEFKRYPHGDTQALEKMLKSFSSFKKRVIITDSVFSMDGDLAPLEEIVHLAQKFDCMVMIDEAHALGVFGPEGQGLARHLGLQDKIDIQMGTLSKAAGSFGAYCCGSKELISFLINKARSFIYTTAMPPSAASASCKALEIIQADSQLRERLWDNTHYVKTNLSKMGFDTLRSESPIIPILVKDSQLAVKFSQRLLEEGIFISAIRPPTVPVNTARLRLTLMATHERKDLDYLLEKSGKIGRELGII